MATYDFDAGKTRKRDEIVEKAKELAVKYRNSTYKLGGKDTTAFDCSYFVYLVLQAVFPAYSYMNTNLIRSTKDPNFRKAEKPQPGDVVLFPAGTVPYAERRGDKRIYPNHVGIVLDNTCWVGRQSSSLGIVLFANPWWGSRSSEYYTYFKVDAAIARSNSRDLWKSFA
jgi:cell wall-associated NlpC family hydrolase